MSDRARAPVPPILKLPTEIIIAISEHLIYRARDGLHQLHPPPSLEKAPRWDETDVVRPRRFTGLLAARLAHPAFARASTHLIFQVVQLKLNLRSADRLLYLAAHPHLAALVRALHVDVSIYSVAHTISFSDFETHRLRSLVCKTEEEIENIYSVPEDYCDRVPPPIAKLLHAAHWDIADPFYWLDWDISDPFCCDDCILESDFVSWDDCFVESDPIYKRALKSAFKTYRDRIRDQHTALYGGLFVTALRRAVMAGMTNVTRLAICEEGIRLRRDYRSSSWHWSTDHLVGLDLDDLHARLCGPDLWVDMWNAPVPGDLPACQLLLAIPYLLHWPSIDTSGRLAVHAKGGPPALKALHLYISWHPTASSIGESLGLRSLHPFSSLTSLKIKTIHFGVDLRTPKPETLDYIFFTLCQSRYLKQVSIKHLYPYYELGCIPPHGWPNLEDLTLRGVSINQRKLETLLLGRKPHTLRLRLGLLPEGDTRWEEMVDRLRASQPLECSFTVTGGAAGFAAKSRFLDAKDFRYQGTAEAAHIWLEAVRSYVIGYLDDNPFRYDDVESEGED